MVGHSTFKIYAMESKLRHLSSHTDYLNGDISSLSLNEVFSDNYNFIVHTVCARDNYVLVSDLFKILHIFYIDVEKTPRLILKGKEINMINEIVSINL